MVVFYPKLHSDLHSESDISGIALAILIWALVLNQWLSQPELYAVNQTAETVEIIPSLNWRRNPSFQYKLYLSTRCISLPRWLLILLLERGQLFCHLYKIKWIWNWTYSTEWQTLKSIISSISNYWVSILLYNHSPFVSSDNTISVLRCVVFFPTVTPTFIGVLHDYGRTPHWQKVCLHRTPSGLVD